MLLADLEERLRGAGLRVTSSRIAVLRVLSGAATHPGGSVIALNGRNAAMAVLADAHVAA